MKKLYLILILTICCVEAFSQAIKNSEGITLKETFEGYLLAVQERDYDALVTYFTEADSIQYVDAKGTVVLSMNDYLEKQKNWFADNAWNYKSELLSIQEFDNTGILIDNTIIYGEGWEYKMVITYVFRKQNNIWRMVSDICTEKK